MPFCKQMKFILLLFSLMFLKAGAQESMMPEVSNVFLNKLIDTAKKYHPRVRTFDHRIIIANDNIKKAQLTWFDLFTFSFLYSPNNSTTLVNPSILTGYQVGIYFNFSNLLLKPHLVKQAKEELAITKLQKEENDLSLVAEVKARYYRFVLQQTLIKIRSLSVVDAEVIMKQLKYRFEKGEESFDNYNKVLVNYGDKRQAVIQTEAELLIAKSNLEELLGKKLEDIN